MFVISTQTGDEMKEIYKGELAWLERCLATWPKSYWVWQQRKWIGALYVDIDWKRELSLCVTMHKADQRNCMSLPISLLVLSLTRPV